MTKPVYSSCVRDGDIRRLLRVKLAREHSSDPTTLLIDELDICGLARVDVAVVNGSLSGYELKSDVDTLRRLPAQVQAYSQVMDRLTLVVGERHAPDAMELIPKWWGVMVVRSLPVPVLEPEREAGWNDRVVAFSLAQLLWREEVLDELTARGLDRGLRSRPRRDLWERLATVLPLDELKAVVRDRLRSREGWRARPAHV